MFEDNFYFLICIKKHYFCNTNSILYSNEQLNKEGTVLLYFIFVYRM